MNIVLWTSVYFDIKLILFAFKNNLDFVQNKMFWLFQFSFIIDVRFLSNSTTFYCCLVKNKSWMTWNVYSSIFCFVIFCLHFNAMLRVINSNLTRRWTYFCLLQNFILFYGWIIILCRWDELLQYIVFFFYGRQFFLKIACFYKHWYPL